MKTPPHSLDAEMSVLGALMVSNLSYYSVSQVLREDDFYTDGHRRIWRAVSSLIKSGRAADLITVGNVLRDEGEPQLASHAMQIASDATGASNADSYARIVRENAKRRNLIAFAFEIESQAHEPCDPDTLMARCSTSLENLMRSATETSIRFGDMAADALVEFERAKKARELGQTIGATFGLPMIDHLTGGFHGPRLVVLAARPKCGKTALLNQLGLYAAQDGKPGLMVSLEMGAAETSARALAAHSGANVTGMQRGSGEHIERARGSLRALQSLPLWFDFHSWNLDAIVSQIAMHKHRHGIQWAAVDHIGLVNTSEKFASRNDQLGHISWTLKQASKRLELPIVALSQLSRSCDTEQRRPRVDDLRDSGNIEQNADMVIMLHVPNNERTNPIRDVQIGVTANRAGPAGWCPRYFRFYGAQQVFQETEQEISR